jgi:hypothetical protein
MTEELDESELYNRDMTVTLHIPDGFSRCYDKSDPVQCALFGLLRGHKFSDTLKVMIDRRAEVIAILSAIDAALPPPAQEEAK